MRKKPNAASRFRRFIRVSVRIILWISLLTAATAGILLKAGFDRASKPITYLPSGSPVKDFTSADSTSTIEIKGISYTLAVSKAGHVRIESVRGEPILTGLTFYSSSGDSGESWNLAQKSVNATSDSTISLTGETPYGALVEMILTVPKNREKIDICITTSYSRNVVVSREALVAGFDIPASEIYTRNRQVDTGPFRDEYWLLREGVRFGRGERAALIYHTPNVSSLQINTQNKLLFINLEYRLDHPYIKIPYQKDGEGKWDDQSDAVYNQGDIRKNSFSINIGNLPGPVPRIMNVPGGYLAGYVFTEHADGGTIKTHRAAYFGSEDIENISDAKGGFAGHQIPVTKSIFFPDIDVPIDSSDANYKNRLQVLKFMDQLRSTGRYDICLHGANTVRKEEERWISWMREHFETVTWIDHGMFAGTGNRQSFVCDGLDTASQYYTADLWEQNKTCYFWNAAVEEFLKQPVKEKLLSLKFYEASVNLWRRNFSAEELSQTGFFKGLNTLLHSNGKGSQEELDSFHPRRGSSMPTPLYWQHPSRTRNFYSWATDYVKIFSHSDQGLKKEEENLRKLVADRGIFINHGYFVRNLYEDGVMIKSNGKLITNPYFDKTLDIMVRMRDAGDLYIPTIKELLDYWRLTEKVSFEYMPDGTVIIKNLTDMPVKDFSLAIKAAGAEIDGVIPKHRKSGDDLIIWFDLEANQSVNLRAG